MALSQLQIEKQKALLDIMGPKISEEEIKKYNLVQKNKENLIKKNYEINNNIINHNDPELIIYGDETFNEVRDLIKKKPNNSFKKKTPSKEIISNIQNNSPLKTKNENSKSIIIKTHSNNINYFDFLIKATDNLINTGEISLDYIYKENTIDINNNNINSYNYNYNNNSNNVNVNNINDNNNINSKFFSNKCRNQICFELIVNSPSVIYCKKCYEAYKKGDYCFYCNIIYRDFKDPERYKDDKSWIQCDYCHKWTHIQCEMEKGVYKNLTKLTNNEHFKYICPICRLKNINNCNNGKKCKIKGAIKKNKNLNDEIYKDLIEILKIEKNNNK